MFIKSAFNKLLAQAKLVDFKLLTFLILFLDVKLAVKIFAILIIYLLQFDLNFGFRLKNSRLPFFYPLIIAIAVFNWIIYGGFLNLKYDLVFLTGLGFWVLCILAVHQIKLSVEYNEPEVLHNTIKLFFILNAIVSLLVLVNIIAEIHTLNPYRYQGNHQKYFIGTGDYIKGISFDVSTTNAILNAFGVIYFLVRKNAGMVLLCMSVMLLTGSNTINILVFLILMFLFFYTSKPQKSIIVVCGMLQLVFLVKVSPQNVEYINKTVYKIRFHKKMDDRLFVTHIIPVTEIPDSLLSPERRKEKIATLYLDSIKRVQFQKSTKLKAPIGMSIAVVGSRPEIPKPSIHTQPFQHIDTVTGQQLVFKSFICTHKAELQTASKPQSKINTPGKFTATQQTFTFLKENPLKLFTGNGIGNFSSKLAFRVTGLGIAGSFPARYAYISPLFLINHLDLYLNFFSRDAGFHSLINSPNSVYDQMLTEYGFIGLLALIIYYFGYFLKNRQYLTYGLPIILLLAGVFIIDYWFEQLSIIVFFELLLMTNIKESASKKPIYGSI